jgi:Family of unknown function (DUF6502)
VHSWCNLAILVALEQRHRGKATLGKKRVTAMAKIKRALEGSKADGNANDISRITESARILLRRTFRILRGCGLNETALRDIAADALAAVERIADQQLSRVTARQALMCSDVVLKWRRDCRYVSSSGLPARLSIAGRSPSFVELVRDAAPGANSSALLANMKELGVIRVSSRNRVELIGESVVACPGRDGSSIASESVLEHICGFLGSVEFNVFDKPSRAKGRFERACYASVPKELVPVIQQLVSARGQEFVDVIDEWLSRRSVRVEARKNDSLLVGAGAYLFVRNNLT